MNRRRLGVVTDGAFNAGLTVRLDPEVSTEELHIGDFVIVEGQENLYFSLIADMQLRTTDAAFTADPPRGLSPFIARALRGTTTYATVQVKPLLMLPRPRGSFIDITQKPQPVRTIPLHFAHLCEASEGDFAAVFGREDKHHFAIGTPLTMDIPICLDLRRLVERSNGVFGATGTGKSFLVRLLLCGVIRSGVAVNLIFDMHDEYAFGKQSEDGQWVKGLTHLFGRSKILVYSLDEQAAVRSGRNVDRTLKIGLNQIEAGDVLLLAEELNLRATAAPTIGLLQDTYGDRWLVELLEMTPQDLDEFCRGSGAHPASMAALQRNLKLIARRPYMVPQADFSMVEEMVAALDKGQNIILHFGRYDTPLDHMLVANIITRRVRHLYQEKVEKYEQTQDPRHRPRSLVITIEEAHKFLNPAVSRQTIFGQIARELRKYYVTLIVVDQRPSGIDPEVLSQLGTRITGKLFEERDIDAVLTGVSGRSFLRGALESLDTREQVLIMGHAVPMPIVVRTRKYDEEFYKAMGEGERPSVRESIEELFGE